MPDVTLRVPHNVLKAVDELAQMVPMTRKAAVCLALGNPEEFLAMLRARRINYTTSRTVRDRASKTDLIAAYRIEKAAIKDKIRCWRKGKASPDDPEGVQLLAARKRLRDAQAHYSEIDIVNVRITAHYEQLMRDLSKIDNELLDLISAPNTPLQSQREHEAALEKELEDEGIPETPENSPMNYPD